MGCVGEGLVLDDSTMARLRGVVGRGLGEGQGTAPTIYFIFARRHEVIEFNRSVDRLKYMGANRGLAPKSF